MRSVVVLLGLFLPIPAFAHEESALHRAQAPGHNPLDCYCRAQGKIFAPGERICLKTAEGPRLAQCQMEINVMSWSITSIPCPETWRTLPELGSVAVTILGFGTLNASQRMPATMAQMKENETHAVAMFSLQAKSRFDVAFIRGPYLNGEAR